MGIGGLAPVLVSNEVSFLVEVIFTLHMAHAIAFQEDKFRNMRVLTCSFSLTVVFCCLTCLCLGVILQVRGRDGVSTLQNGAAAYSQSGISLFARVPSIRFSSSCPIGHSVYGCTCVLYIGLRTTAQQ